MRRSPLNADQLTDAALRLSRRYLTAILDSCGSTNQGSRYLIVGIEPAVRVVFNCRNREQALSAVASIDSDDYAKVFTLAYDLGLTLNGIDSRHPRTGEPDVFSASFDALIIHDYERNETFLDGDPREFDRIERRLAEAADITDAYAPSAVEMASDLTANAYLDAVESLKDEIRSGWTYQTNLTRKLSNFGSVIDGPAAYSRLRSLHPAAFSAFIKRPDSTVISASPELFFRIVNDTEGRKIVAAPIKGTRPRGTNSAEDELLRRELETSEKDRAENAMIVDLLRNDIGRVCEFGSVRVDDPFAIEQHPSLFHMVSRVEGRLRPDAGFAQIIDALFPCGSITGAPKVSTMRIIDRYETSRRGLSMGSIGIRIPEGKFAIGPMLDLSVAIRTMVLSPGYCEFRVGGGIVIDSEPSAEWLETKIKSTALLDAVNAAENN